MAAHSAGCVYEVGVQASGGDALKEVRTDKAEERALDFLDVDFPLIVFHLLERLVRLRLSDQLAQNKSLDPGTKAHADDDVRAGDQRSDRREESVEGSESCDWRDMVGLEASDLGEGDSVLLAEDRDRTVTPEQTVHAVQDDEFAIHMLATAEAEVAVRVHLLFRDGSLEEPCQQSVNDRELRDEVASRTGWHGGQCGRIPVRDVAPRRAMSVARASLCIMTNAFPWVLSLALLLALLVVILVAHRRRSAAAEEARRRGEEHDRSTAELTQAHEERLAGLSHANGLALASVQEELAASRQEAEQARRRLARTWSGEAVSHDLISEACVSAGLAGLLATNVIFVPADARSSRRFVAQIDHLLVTGHGAMIIEAKYWQGVVFDGVLPATVHASYAGLFDESELIEPFTVQIAPAASDAWTVRTHLEHRVPARQVRRQAARFAEFLTGQGRLAPWFETAVLYSHPDVTTFAPAWQGTGRARTRIVTGVKELTDMLAELARRPESTLAQDEWESLSTFLAETGAHLERVGPASRA